MYRIQRKALDDLCRLLDMIVSFKKIPRKVTLSSLQCCLLVTTIDLAGLHIGILIDAYDNNQTQFIFGLNELFVLRQLQERFSHVWDDYDKERSIKKSYCFGLICFVNRVNVFLKDAVKKLYRNSKILAHVLRD